MDARHASYKIIMTTLSLKSLHHVLIWMIILLFNFSVRAEILKSKTIEPNFECLNGKDPGKLTAQEILLEFSQGPCSPFILAPGTLSTKLMVEISSCENLKNDFPEIWQSCKFTHCTKEWWEFWRHVPESEYELWIPDLLSPMNIFTINETSNFCFARFMKMYINFNKPIEDSLIENSSFQVKIYGTTPGTQNAFQCGDGAVMNLLPFQHLQLKETKVFADFFKRVSSMGYVPGLTYQTIPYNYEKSYRNNEFKKFFKDNLIRLKHLTGKKVIVMGHSMGNFNIYSNLIRFKQEEKDELIKSWVSLGYPALGSMKINNNYLNGDDELIYFHKLIGLHVDASIEGGTTILANYEMIYRDAFTMYKDEPWLQDIKKRIDYENGQRQFEDSGFEFLPKTTDVCSPANFEMFSQACKLGIYDSSAEPHVRILNEEYYLHEIDRLYTRWGTTPHIPKYLKYTVDDDLFKLENPGIPILAFNTRTQATMQYIQYNVNMTEYIIKDKFVDPIVTAGYGDGTVPANSLFIPTLKWAHQFQNKTDPNARPVKFIDVCSFYNQKQTAYDAQSDNGEFIVDKNEFIGVQCDCMNEKTPMHCNHSTMVSDSHVISMLQNILMTQEKSHNAEYQEKVLQIDSEYLRVLTDECPQIGN